MKRGTAEVKTTPTTRKASLSQDQSDRGPPRIDTRVSRMALSKSAVERHIWLGGQARRM